MNFIQELETNGYTIINNVLTQQRCLEHINGLFNFMENFKYNSKLSRYDASTWEDESQWAININGIIQNYKVGQSQSLWDIRNERSIYDIFYKIWDINSSSIARRYTTNNSVYSCDSSKHEKGYNNLLVSFDGFSMVHSKMVRKKLIPPHTDQSLLNSNETCIQGLINLLPTDSNYNSSFSCIPGSHQIHSILKNYIIQKNMNISNVEADIIKKLNLKKDWYKLKHDELAQITNERETNYRFKKLDIPQGALVLWDSRLLHTNQLKFNRTTEHLERCVAYVCYKPRSFSTPAQLKKKVKYFEDRRSCNHNPNKCSVFPDMPSVFRKSDIVIRSNTKDKINFRVNDNIEVSDICKKFAGY
jgi:hypothetical protein